MNKKKQLTLVIIQKNQSILLGMKKRGFGEGKWNGFGGKLEEDEALETAALREVKEESDISVSNLVNVGLIEFDNYDIDNILCVHIFKTRSYEGEPKESEEMRPKWFHIDQIPYESMWPDDAYWMPLLLEGKLFTGSFRFGKDGEVLEHKLDVVTKLSDAV